jgi:hypothetical protein
VVAGEKDFRKFTVKKNMAFSWLQSFYLCGDEKKWVVTTSDFLIFSSQGKG